MLKDKRIIKFRYWNTVNKIMILNPQMPYKEGWTIEQLFSERGWVWLQFTGLLDKNGKEIYEGDIVRISDDFIEIMEWVGDGDWMGEKQPLVGFVHHQSIYKKPIEVIGNIYENPELVKT